MDGDRRNTVGESGWVFNIQHFSVHDGPGIRTTVFLKGCPLRCLWCDNPESQDIRPHIFFWSDRCIGCNQCLSVCPHHAVIEVPGVFKQVQGDLCDLCGACLAECHSGALEQVGKLMTAAEVLEQIELDRPFYDQSGGGMTLSGGESLAQPDFAGRLLGAAKARGIHTAIETCGFAAWDVWQRLLPHLDLILYDVKEVDPSKHRIFTGVSNRLILKNLERLAKTDVPVIVRRPVIPGYNDDVEDMHALGHFVQQLQTVCDVHLLPYHRLGYSKYDRLGRKYMLGDKPAMENDALTELGEILLSYGLKVRIGG